MAEGPTIQRAAERSLANGTKIRDVFELVRRFREIDQDTPLILMGYMNPVESRGYEAWAGAMATAGADGLIVVDCPPEEAGGLTDALDAHDLAPDPPGDADIGRVASQDTGSPHQGFSSITSRSPA